MKNIHAYMHAWKNHTDYYLLFENTVTNSVIKPNYLPHFM